MGKYLKLLEELQEIDLKLDVSRGEKEALLADLADLELKLEASGGTISTKKDDLAQMEEERRGVEESLAAEGENIVRSEGRLREIKTQKEYQAVSKEIAAAKKLKVELEEQLLQKISQIDEMAAEVAAMEENLNSLTEGVAARKLEIKSRIDQLEADMNADITVREPTAKGIPTAVLNRYAMLREKRQGLAVVEARNGSCLGCNMNLPPQVYNNLFKADSLIACPHCQRLLFLRLGEGEAG